MRQRRSDGSLGLITLRFPPPLSGGAQKTGWEALDKWVGGGGGSGGEAAAGGAEPSVVERIIDYTNED